jgi:hypothetical protein
VVCCKKLFNRKIHPPSFENFGATGEAHEKRNSEFCRKGTQRTQRVLTTKYTKPLFILPNMSDIQIVSMNRLQLLGSKREQILSTARKHGAISLKLFGSTARGQAIESSDFDFVVELEPGRTLLDLGGLQSDLERLLGCAVDVVTANGLRERIRSRVLAEAVPV